MRSKKLFLIGMFLLVGVLLISFVSAYARSSYRYTQYSGGSGLTGIEFSNEQCESGQDFILQIEPFGCEPAVVRSDLLEEQNVPVFCKISAMQLNPLIEVEAIDSISFSGQYPREVSGIGFRPSQEALGYGTGEIDSPILDNIGYAMIVLRQQPNESALTNCEDSDFGGEVCWVEGNLTARIRYDIENAFGIGQANFYLPELDDGSWNSKQNQYGFWDGMGYLRAESVGDDNAIIGVYASSSAPLTKSTDKMKVTSANLKVGETSSRIFIPGFDGCLANMRIKLNGLESPDTRAVLKINNDVVEVKRGEKFLDNKCYIRKMNQLGLSQDISVVCQEDDSEGFLKTTTFDLRIEPQIKLQIEDKEEDYSVGDYLYSGGDGKFVYLGYLGTRGDSEKLEDLYAYFVSIPESAGDKLDEGELQAVADIVEGYNSAKDENKNIGSFAVKLAKVYKGGAIQFYKWMTDGQSIEGVNFGENIKFGERSISIKGFGDGMDVKETSALKEQLDEYVDNANENYDTIINSFSGEKESEESLITFGEEAFYQKIVLAGETGQRETMIQLCDEFRNEFPNSEKNLENCDDYYRISNTEVSSQEVLVNGNIKKISFVRIQEPSTEEYGAKVYVGYPNGEIIPYTLGKDDIVYLDSTTGEYLQLISLDEDSAKVEVYLQAKTTGQQIVNYLTPSSSTLKLNVAKGLGNGYQFTLKDVNLKKVAKVSLIPNIDYAQTEADFKFKIGIEKRAFQLTPEKTQSRIDNLNESIEKWNSISETLKGTNKALQTACIGTGAALTIKNFVQNSAGKAFARQKVMQGGGGWNEICAGKVSRGEYDSIDECFIKEAPNIDAQVNIYYSILQQQNTEIKAIQDGHTEQKLLRDDYVDTDALMLDYSKKVQGEVSGLTKVENSAGEEIDLDNIQKALDYSSWKSNNYDVEELREIEFYTRVLDKYPNDKTAQERLYGLMYDASLNAKADIEKDNFANSIGVDADKISFLKVGENAKELPYNGLTKANVNANIPGDATDPVEVIITSDGKKYFAVLDDSGIDALPIKSVDNTQLIYDVNGNLVSDMKVLEEFRKVYFKKYDVDSYKNEFISVSGENGVVVKYYETDPYKGYPAIVPVDVDEGWYAATKQSGIAAFDDSGRVSSFWLCNVGEDGIAEFNSGIGDDVCRQVNLFTGEPYNEFPGLESGEALKLTSKAVGYIEQAQRAYKNGVSRVRLGGESFKVGNPATAVSEIQCTDFMSPKECNILFNVCDPVICPSSRCDFGGTYPVQDVVQSGIIGSIALCLPNWKEKIYVPVCLTGVQAGIENWVSVQESYRDCLDTSLKTGETVGVCDEIHSVYMCEFFWKQALPLAKLAVPKIVSTILGQNSHGGAEYLGVASAWENAQNSVNYMTQYYAANSYNAFKYRSTEQVGTEVCKSFASLTYPEGSSILDAITEPESPAQFSGKFEEIEFTTSTNPPISQYKVYYHIYAGNDRGAYYNVYLSEGETSSFYQDTSFRRQVDSGYVVAGDYASETIDFTAPSGYKQLCIVVNGQEECGFKQVSTSFALNYVEDAYIEEMISDTDIETEEECVSGKVSLYSAINTNVQEGVENVINPEIYQEGITRVCSTDNPGSETDPYYGTENQRWLEVGSCGDSNIKCWIDTDSVKDVIEFQDIEDGLLESYTDKQLEALQAEGKYIDDKTFKSKLEEFEKLTTANEKLDLIAGIYDKVFYNNQKAKLLLLRGNVYAGLALEAYNEYVESRKIGGECDNSVIGSEILSTAKSKIGQDTTRLEEGNEVYDNVCATFVSNVLIEEGVMPGYTSCSLETTPYRDAIVELVTLFEKSDNFAEVSEEYWEGGLRPGDLIIWGGSGDFKPEFQHITIFESYEGNGIRVVHDGGKGVNIAEKVYENPFGKDWYITHVWRAGCSKEGKAIMVEQIEDLPEEDVYISPVFEFKDGKTKINGNVKYSYFEGAWHWGYSTEDWISLDRIKDSSGRELDDSNKILSQSINENNKNYLEGLDLLMKEVFKDDYGRFLGIIKSHPSLKTDKVELDYDGVFEFNAVTGLNNEPIYIKYESEWFVSFAGKVYRDDYWFPISEIIFDKLNNQISWNEKKVTGFVLSDNMISFVESLDGKSFLDGSSIIFEKASFNTNILESSEISTKINSEIDSSSFSEEQLSVLANADNCKDCLSAGYGQEHVCSEKLCEAVGVQIGEYCEFTAAQDILELDSCLSKGKRPVEKEKSAFDLMTDSEKIETIKNAIDKADIYLQNSNIGDVKYSQNGGVQTFVANLNKEGVLTDEEFDKIDGNWFSKGWRLSAIKELLQQKCSDLGGDCEGDEESDNSENTNSLIDFCDTKIINKEYTALQTFIEVNELENIDVCGFISIEENHIVLVNFRNSEIKDITSLSFFDNIQTINLANNDVTSLDVLKNLNSLASLDVSYNCLPDDTDEEYLDFAANGIDINYDGNPRDDCS